MNKILLALLLFFPSLAQAGPDYLPFGTGEARAVNRGNGFWEDPRHQIVNNLESNVWQLGLGWNIKSWLDVEVTYTNFGRVSKLGVFETEPHHAIEGVENSFYIGTGYGKTQCISGTAIPKWAFTRPVELFGRGGLAICEHQWKQYWTQVQGPDNPSFPKDFAQNGTKGKDTSRVIVLGGGLLIKKQFTLEYTHYFDFGSDSSGQKGIGAVTFNVRIPL